MISTNEQSACYRSDFTVVESPMKGSLEKTHLLSHLDSLPLQISRKPRELTPSAAKNLVDSFSLPILCISISRVSVSGDAF